MVAFDTQRYGRNRQSVVTPGQFNMWYITVRAVVIYLISCLLLSYVNVVFTGCGLTDQLTHRSTETGKGVTISLTLAFGEVEIIIWVRMRVEPIPSHHPPPSPHRDCSKVFECLIILYTQLLNEVYVSMI